MRHLSRQLGLLAAVACTLLAPATASATSTPAEISASVSNGVKYLKTLQENSGTITGFGGDWSLTSFAAAGTAAADVKETKTSTDARTWYRGLVGNKEWPGVAKPPASEFERAALLSYAAGIDPARVSATQNLIGQIAGYYEPATPGYYGEPGVFNGTVFGLLALADTKTTGGVQRVPQVVLKKSIEVVEKNQHNDGGWSWQQAEGKKTVFESPSEPDLTGAAIAALCTAGESPSTNASLKKGIAFLKSLLVSSSGAFASEFGVNTDSNAWAVQGLNACKVESQGAEFTTPMGKTPIDFLISQQLKKGSFKYLPSETAASEYSSQDAVRALAGAGFTATPPKPTKAAQWEASSEFVAGEPAPLMLVINNESSALKVCKVTMTVGAGEPTTTLGKVLERAVVETKPAECVSGFSSEGATKAINQINGFPATPIALWDVSIDGGAEEKALTSKVIHLGDTIYLRFT